MSAHEGVKAPGGTTFYFTAKAAAAHKAPGDVRRLLADLTACVDACLKGAPFDSLSLSGYDISQAMLDDVLGEGEIKLWVREPDFVTEVLESVMPGVWRLIRRTHSGEVVGETVDVGALPRLVDDVMARHTAPEPSLGAMPEGTMSAGPILEEIRYHITREDPYTIVLTNLPMAPGDMDVLNEVLGEGPVAGGSKGYSTTRVRSAKLRRVWRVNYLNSDGQVIYDAVEITRAPLSLAAPREDIEDGRHRLADLMEIYK